MSLTRSERTVAAVYVAAGLAMWGLWLGLRVGWIEKPRRPIVTVSRTQPPP